MSAADQATIREMCGTKRAHEIAEVIGRPRTTVDNYLKRNGLKRPDLRFGPRKVRPQAEPKPPVCRLPWPKPDRHKEWPRNCFKHHDVSQEMLDREFTRIRDKPPLRSERFGVPAYG